MSFEYKHWDTRTTLGVMRETEEVPNYWLSLLFPNMYTSHEEYIDLEKIPSRGRKLAPFVVPMAQGRPIYEEASRIARFKPAYIKPSDPVDPARALRKRPGQILAPTQPNPMARYNAVKTDILAYHRNAIERRWEWMAAKAAIDGKVLIAGDDYPPVLVDFGRDAGHTIVLGAGARWGDSGVSIYSWIQARIDQMHAAEFGGAPTRITMGTGAWAVMRQDPEIKAQMDLTVRGTDADLKLGLLPAGEVRYVGTIGNGLIELYVYNDWYTVGGTKTPFMSPKDVVFTGPGVEGFQCFGAIQDVHAQFQPLPIFSRNYMPAGDVAIEQIVSASAPLMVPVNPNATLKATVVA